MTGQQYDPVKVRAAIADAVTDVRAQQALVDRLDELLDDEQRELTRREQRLSDMREAWAARGVDVTR